MRVVLQLFFDGQPFEVIDCQASEVEDRVRGLVVDEISIGISNMNYEGLCELQDLLKVLKELYSGTVPCRTTTRSD